ARAPSGEGGGEPAPLRLAPRKAEAEPGSGVGEDARPDPRARQPLLRLRGRRSIVEPEQGRSADAAPTGPGGKRIEPPCFAGKPVAGVAGPGVVGKRGGADLDGGAVDGPGSGHVRKPGDLGGRREDEPQPEPREAVELAERPEDERAVVEGAARDRGLRRRVREALVHDDPPDAARQRPERVGREHATVRIVWVDDNGQI